MKPFDDSEIQEGISWASRSKHRHGEVRDWQLRIVLRNLASYPNFPGEDEVLRLIRREQFESFQYNRNGEGALFATIVHICGKRGKGGAARRAPHQLALKLEGGRI